MSVETDIDFDCHIKIEKLKTHIKQNVSEF